MRSLFNLFILLSVVASCRQEKQITEDEKIEIIDAVQKTIDNYNNDIKESGLIAEFKYLDNSSDFFWVPPGYAEAIS